MQKIFPVCLLIAALFVPNAGLAGGQEAARSPLLDSWEQHVRLRKDSRFALEWISIGPTLNSARLEAVQGDPTRPGTLYAAFGSGNLWKTVNHGLSWTPIFENQSALGIGDIALAPSNPDVIWLGSGESLKKARNFTLPGTGVFRSDDGGATWRNLGLHDSYHIGEIAVHPENPDIAFVAVLGHFWSANPNRGLYRTIDGGRTWEQVLYIDEATGANDVVIARSDPRVIYASMWEHHPNLAGGKSGVYRSSDGGATWQRLPNGFASGPRVGRIGMAVSWTDPDKVYALVDNLNRKRDRAAEVYRSDNGGADWRRTHDKDLLIFPGIGWYFTDCYVNPKNDEEIYALGVRMARSTDGGKTFELIGGDVYHLFPSSADPLHLDHCELWIDPSHPERMALGNDGGLYVTHDRGGSWLHHNNIPAGEFYDITVDNQDPYRVYGGTQDDATVYGPAREWLGKYPDGWRYIWVDAWSGGDGCVTQVDPEDPNTVYFSSQNGHIMRKDMRADRSKSVRPRLPEGQEEDLAYNFVAPYLISPHDPHTLYHGGNRIFKSTDRGDSWTLISPDLSKSSDPARHSLAAGALAESRLQPGLLYVGTDHGAFWVSEDDGATWVERSEGLPPAYIRSIQPSRFAVGRVYLAATGINYDDLSNHLFLSEDHGETWRSLTGNLPDEPANVILEDPVRENILYAGLHRGVCISVDRGRSWSPLGRGMPAVSIGDLEIQEREMDLLAGTHGRGIYRVNLRPLQQAFTGAGPASATLFEPPPARLPWINDTHRDPRYSTMEKVPITFYLPEAADVTVTVFGANRRPLWKREIRAGLGFNQVRWDLVMRRVDSPRPYFVNYLRFIPAGAYTIEVSGEGIDLSVPLVVVERSTPPGF